MAKLKIITGDVTPLPPNTLNFHKDANGILTARIRAGATTCRIPNTVDLIRLTDLRNDHPSDVLGENKIASCGSLLDKTRLVAHDSNGILLPDIIELPPQLYKRKCDLLPYEAYDSGSSDGTNALNYTLDPIIKEHRQLLGLPLDKGPAVGYMKMSSVGSSTTANATRLRIDYSLNPGWVEYNRFWIYPLTDTINVSATKVDGVEVRTLTYNNNRLKRYATETLVKNQWHLVETWYNCKGGYTSHGIIAAPSEEEAIFTGVYAGSGRGVSHNVGVQ